MPNSYSLILNACNGIYRGRRFIWEHLRMEDIECYWEKLLKRYAKLMKWKPVFNQSLRLVRPGQQHEEL